MVDMGVLVGSFRRFGLFGPTYEVIGPGAPGPSGEPRMRIRLIATGEITDYGVASVVADPIED
jgi:hypothetical protein